jgi:molecular chaperone DnaK (HSP70)
LASTSIGIDFGTLKTVIAVARNRGVDVVRIPSPPAVYPSRQHYPSMRCRRLHSNIVDGMTNISKDVIADIVSV